MTWLVALASLYGHPPEEARKWSVRDLQLVEVAHNTLREQSPFWSP